MIIRTEGRISSRSYKQRRGVILLAVLVVVAILTLIGYRFFTLMNAEHEAAYASNRVMQGRYMADSGLQYAAFVLSYPQNVGLSDAPDETSNLAFPGLIYDNPDVFHMRPVTSGARSQGFFSIVSPRSADDPLLSSARQFRFGPEDEGGKINLNALLKMDRTGQLAAKVLSNLPNMTPEIANSIIYWMNNSASAVSTSGSGDAMYYSSLGYTAKNGPFETLEELLLVQGITPRLLFGNDLNRNGYLDPEEDDGSGAVDRGWSRFLTVYSRERNVDSTGAARVWINDTDLTNLETNLQNAGVDDDLIAFILAYRMYGGGGQTMSVVIDSAGSARTGGSTTARVTSAAISSDGATFAVTLQAAQPSNVTESKEKLKRSNIDTSKADSSQLHNISSLYDLIDATVTIPSSSEEKGQGQGQNQQQSVQYKSPLQKSDLATLRELLPPLFDKATTSQQTEMTPRININTAPMEVLQALETLVTPNLTDADIQNILENRPGPQSDPSQGPIYRTPAWLITEAQLDPKVVQSLEKYITTRSQVYRVQVVGYYEQGGPTVRLEAVIDTNGGRPKLLYWRDLTELGRGYDLRNAPP